MFQTAPVNSLRKHAAFQHVYKRGRAHNSSVVVVRVAPNQLDITRVGFVVTKAIGNAVIRNRVRRRLREVIRRLDRAHGLAPGLDIVVNARKPAVDIAYEPLTRTLATLLARANALSAAPASGDARADVRD